MATFTTHHSTYPFIAPEKFASTLTGRVVLITGASRGIGRATALAFANAGASIAAVARSTSDLESLLQTIRDRHPGLPTVAITADLLTADIPAIIREAESELGPIDILINNAGITRMARFSEEPSSSLDAWWKVHELNVRMPMSFIRAVLPTFLARGSGTIISVGTILAGGQWPYMSAYSSSKAALHKAIQHLDIELRPKEILNYVIQPGAVGETQLMFTKGATLGKEMEDLMNAAAPYAIDSVDLSADTMVALVALGNGNLDDRVKALSGRFLDSTWDLGEVLKTSERIEREDMYKLVHSM